jgi:branched-chain amino acid transport system permease protein
MNLRAASGFAALGLALFFVPNLRDATGSPVYLLVFLYSLFYWITQATSWNILSGYSGYFSFGQSAFVGVGLYSTAILVVQYHTNFFLSVLLAGVVSTLLALGVGFVAFQLRSLRGEIFTLLTFVVAFVLAAVAQLSAFVDGGQGRAIRRPDFPEFLGGYNDLIYRMGAVMVVAALVVAYSVQHSRFGRGLFGIRDDEDVAEALGAPTFRFKMAAFGISGFLAGAAGGLNALQVSYLTIETTFNFIVPLFVILMATLGGRRHWIGPVIGAVLIYTLQERLAHAGFAESSQIVLGAILALTILFVPEGLYVRLRARWRLALTVFLVTWAFEEIVYLFPELLARLFLAIVVVLPFLVVPDRFLRRLSWLRPRRKTGRSAAADAAPQSDATPADPPDTEPPAILTVEHVVERPVEPSGPARPLPAASGSPLLECRDIHKEFSGLRALGGLSFNVMPGEIVALVGPNGSGKSTLINVMSGTFAPTSGQVVFNGAQVTGLSSHAVSRLGIARTYQIPRPFETMTVLENVAFPAMFRSGHVSQAEATRIAWECLEFTNLAGVAHHLPVSINLQQRKFLELARALAAKPSILMLDEVLTGLNPAEIGASVEMIRKIHASSITLIIVEHLMRVVTELATKLVVLNQGTLLAQGDPHEVMRRDDVVTAYLGREHA